MQHVVINVCFYVCMCVCVYVFLLSPTASYEKEPSYCGAHYNPENSDVLGILRYTFKSKRMLHLCTRGW